MKFFYIITGSIFLYPLVFMIGLVSLAQQQHNVDYQVGYSGFSSVEAMSIIRRETILRYLARGGHHRRQAIWYIYQHGYDDLLGNAVEYLERSPDFDDHRAILNVLRAYNYDLETFLPDWYEYLDSYMDDTVPEDILLECIDLAMKWNEHRLIHALGRMAEHPASAVRQRAFYAMSSIGNDNLIPVLLRMSHSGRAVERIYSLEGMTEYRDERLRPRLQNLLSDENKSVRIYALEALLSQGNDASRDLQRMYGRENDPDVKARIIEMIGRKGYRRLVAIPRRELANSDAEIRMAAMNALARLNDRASARHLSRALDSESEDRLKQRAIRIHLILGSGGGQGLIRILLHDQSESLRVQAAAVLGSLEESAGTPALETALLNDPSARVRLEAAISLGKTANSGSLTALRRSFLDDHENEQVRNAALVSMVNLTPASERSRLYELADQLNNAVLKGELLRLLSN